ncbi:MAG TPA: sigma-70 factor domain-containing protein, partial [Pseudonocardiaceae bacterium]
MAAAEPASRRATASKSATSKSAPSNSGAEEAPSPRNGTASDTDLAAVARPKGTKSGVARTRPKTHSTAAKAVPKPADVAGPVDVEAEIEETVDIESGPAAEDLVEVEVEVEEITVDPEEPEAPSGPGAEDFVWDEEESEALRQARKDAELTASADSVRAYLKQIGKVALLNAEEEVELAKRIEAGLYAAERVRRSDDTEKLSPQLRRDLRWIVRDGERAKNHLLEANLRLVVS